MEEIMVELARHSERLDGLEEWQDKQNGHLERLEGKMDRIYMWLVGVLGGVITSLGLLIANLILLRR